MVNKISYETVFLIYKIQPNYYLMRKYMMCLI